MSILHRANAMVQATYELLDSVEAQLSWMVQFGIETHAPAERLASLSHLMSRTRAALQEIYLLQTRSTYPMPVSSHQLSDEKKQLTTSDVKVPLPTRILRNRKNGQRSRANTLVDRYDEVERLRELNTLLLDNLHTTVVWIAQYSQRTGTKIPNLDNLLRLMKEGMKLLNEMVAPAPK